MVSTISKKLPLLVTVWLLYSFPVISQDDPVSFMYTQNLGSDECFHVLFDDFNQDGNKDALVINFNASSKIWTNQGNGSFVISGKSFGSNYNHGAALGDLDNDGDNDLVIVSTMDVDKVYFNDGTGTFTVHQSLGAQMDLTTQCLLGDLDGDGDGDLDLLTAHTLKPNKIWLNDGQGTFTLKAQIGTDASYYMDLADIDQDGDEDLYIEQNDAKDLILINDGQGNFTDSGLTLGFADGNGHGVFRDFNGDSYPDLFLPNDSNGSILLLNQVGTAFTQAGLSFGEGNTAGILDADLDGDLDVILSKFDGGTQLFINFGDYQFRSYGSQFAAEKCWSITCEDIDGDGDEDVILGNSAMHARETKLYLNQAADASSVGLLKKEPVFRIYPNPASGILNIDLAPPVPGCYRIVLSGINSRQDLILMEQDLHSGTTHLACPITNLIAGIYLCSLYFRGECLASARVILM